MVTREAESRRMETSAPGVLVTRRVRWFYDHDSDINHAFGRWELFSHNCEDFARFCKILKLGSKQGLTSTEDKAVVNW